MAIISKKICLIGDFCVGKTSLIRRFVDQQFSDQYLSTVGVKISKKLLTLPEQPNHLQMLIWDIEGSTTFKKIAPSYFQGAAAAILVADVTRPETIDNLSQHAQDFRKVNPRGHLVIALNKFDLVEVSQFAALSAMSQLPPGITSFGTYETSAKTGTGVDQAFQTIGSAILQAQATA